MKRKLSLLLVLVMLFAVALSACNSTEEGTEGTEGNEGTEAVNIKLATGGTTGTYYAYGGVLGTLFESKIDGLTVDRRLQGQHRFGLRRRGADGHCAKRRHGLCLQRHRPV